MQKNEVEVSADYEYLLRLKRAGGEGYVDLSDL